MGIIIGSGGVNYDVKELYIGSGGVNYKIGASSQKVAFNERFEHVASNINIRYFKLPRWLIPSCDMIRCGYIVGNFGNYGYAFIRLTNQSNLLALVGVTGYSSVATTNITYTSDPSYWYLTFPSIGSNQVAGSDIAFNWEFILDS